VSVVIITGSSGLIGSEAAKFFHDKGLHVVGIDNNMRKYFFGEDGCSQWNTQHLKTTLKNFTHFSTDIRHKEEIDKIFEKYAKDISLVVHTAAQPSHDWAAKEPFTDFTVNANGTLVMLDATRRFCPDAPFVFTSTNKVYGDLANSLPLEEKDMRYELVETDRFFQHGIDESMSIDQSLHSIFGASKVAADVLTQEYGRYFGLKTGVFRGGCLTGPAHSPAELHGFLAYLVKCAASGRPYTVFGYKGKQVRDNIHSYDLVNAFWHFFKDPKVGAVYNIGGSRYSNCSVLEAISAIERLSGCKMDFKVVDSARRGDHKWWISDVRKFQNDFPDWKYEYDLNRILEELVEVAKADKARVA